MITQALLILALLFGGPGLPVQIERTSAGRIFYGFGDAAYIGGCTPATGPAQAQRIELAGRHLFTVVHSGDCAVVVVE